MYGWVKALICRTFWNCLSQSMALVWVWVCSYDNQLHFVYLHWIHDWFGKRRLQWKIENGWMIRIWIIINYCVSWKTLTMNRLWVHQQAELDWSRAHPFYLDSLTNKWNSMKFKEISTALYWSHWSICIFCHIPYL